ncbi:MAG: chorismate synthase [Candidatus Limivicinus sp.]
MSSSYGENLHLTIFGQSHSPAIGMTLEGIPAGEQIDFEALQRFLERRAPGRNAYSTARKEADAPEFLSGLRGDTTCGVPLTAIIRNGDTRSKDYAPFSAVPRPGHADYTANVKYFGHQDYAGGGHFSGRLTAPLCIAGGVCLQILQRHGIEVISRIRSIGDVKDPSPLTASTAEKAFPTVDEAAGEAMQAAIAQARAQGDSLGGVIECAVLGLPAGLGDPMFGGMENRIAGIVFGIPAVKGVEFGAGFAAAKLRGSQNNDSYTVQDGRIETRSNHCGGILGGITNGMPLVFRAAIKPTPSIAMEQTSVNLETRTEEKLRVGGRHDPCIVPRAVPVIEAAAAIAVYDALLGRKKELREEAWT